MWVMHWCDEQKSPLPARPVSTACGATSSERVGTRKKENTPGQQTPNTKVTYRRHTIKQCNNKGWDEEKGGMELGENAESREQSKNKIKTMSNMEIIKINHYTVKGRKKTEKMSTYPQSTKEK